MFHACNIFPLVNSKKKDLKIIPYGTKNMMNLTLKPIEMLIGMKNLMIEKENVVEISF